jgi:hypothetical protein
LLFALGGFLTPGPAPVGLVELLGNVSSCLEPWQELEPRPQPTNDGEIPDLDPPLLGHDCLGHERLGGAQPTGTVVVAVLVPPPAVVTYDPVIAFEALELPSAPEPPDRQIAHSRGPPHA